MCAIFGFYRTSEANDSDVINPILQALYEKCRMRGKDAAGVLSLQPDLIYPTPKITNSVDRLTISIPRRARALLGNCRAEPTNEWQREMKPQDVQPYLRKLAGGAIAIVHNGTIANDKDFIDEDYPTKIDSASLAHMHPCDWSKKLVGSIAAAGYVTEENSLYLARNYRPLALVETSFGYFFASERDALLDVMHAFGQFYQDLSPDPYTLTVLCPDSVYTHVFQQPKVSNTAIVICSGGMDSTVAATVAAQTHEKVILAHFHYGCRAESQETKSVYAVAEHLRKHTYAQIEVQLLDLSFLKQLGGNPLVDTALDVATGEAGVEFAHEWVPFRNGLMLSMIAAYCDRWNIGHIYLGANLEEAGAFGDNEFEFYQHMQRAIQIGSKAAPTVHNPLDHLMKHEIVRLAHDIDAPIHLSWSCYHGGDKHCGDCGPCFLRRKAHAMNNLTDTLEYAK
jgi:7-cyano-7-deazaguanine synthase